MQDVFAVLEIEKILAEVSSYAKTEEGKQRISCLRPHSEDSLKSELSFLSDFLMVSPSLGALCFGSGENLRYPLSKAKKGGRLLEQELYSLVLYGEDAENAKQRLDNIDVDNEVTDFIAQLPDIGFITKRIQEVVAPDLHILDSASAKLKAIRRDIVRKKREANAILPTLLHRYEGYLNASSFAYKDGHYTLPVSITYKNKVRGILIDLSQSENTAFIEPEELLTIQNQIAEKEAEEKEEIMTLLSELSALVGQNYDEVSALYDELVALDIVQAKALYGFARNGHLPTISEDGSLYLPQARHPLLDPTSVIPNDFVLKADAKVVVISGPNAGGKTVALKTLAVNVLLFEMAIPCLCDQGAYLPYFKHLYCDIGDQQSIEENLSTFSAHMANIADICKKAGGKDIVFLDEVGTGTSPKEGEALAASILQYLENKHAYCLVSSHFEGLKALALENPRFDNACLIYDEENFKPTYRLRFGSPGESYGLMAAKRFGLQEEILTAAKKRLSARGEGGVAYAIKKLTKLQKENEELSAELKKKEEALKNESRKLKVETNNLQREKEKFTSSLDELREKVIEDARAEVDATIKELANPELKLHQAIALKKRLDDLQGQEEEAAPKKKKGVFEVGDYVEIEEYQIQGRIKRISGSSAVVSTPQGKDYKVGVGSLIHCDDPEPKEEVIKGAFLDGIGSSSVRLECNLIGMRAEEAEAELDRYLDRCRLAGFNRVRIIHGFGSGALRNMTHAYLRAHKNFVASFEMAGPQEGGSGATVVYLK